MKRFYVDYLDKCDDLCHVWVDASSASEAESEVRSEYWDISEILSIHS